MTAKCINALGIFCEDIREERTGLTLIGVFPDNINLAVETPGEVVVIPSDRPMPKRISQLCIYARVNFGQEENIDSIIIRLIFPDGKKQELGVVSRETIEGAKKKAKSKGNPLAGVIARATVGGFNIAKPGVMKLEMDIGGESYLVAALNFKFPEVTKPATASSPSETVPPSLQ